MIGSELSEEFMTSRLYIAIYTLCRRENLISYARSVNLDVGLEERVDIWNILNYMFTFQIYAFHWASVSASPKVLT